MNILPMYTCVCVCVCVRLFPFSVFSSCTFVNRFCQPVSPAHRATESGNERTENGNGNTHFVYMETLKGLAAD